EREQPALGAVVQVQDVVVPFGGGGIDVVRRPFVGRGIVNGEAAGGGEAKGGAQGRGQGGRRKQLAGWQLGAEANPDLLHAEGAEQALDLRRIGGIGGQEIGVLIGGHSRAGGGPAELGVESASFVTLGRAEVGAPDEGAVGLGFQAGKQGI